ncbi:ABC transporter substrate-binding protein [Bacillus sp. ISL-18]|uniref:ABC transporter substrate-binding protein n=1 Tax=Bacillus sp. ISL-18 TaxID=2819118 RepID=UPI001BE9AEC3|nr:ABC transporter substrate-binding protein [Bacillus sp. ISL-18]MBT2654434.1 ABC transporter substrate-binding protein [Bacillus sp. ISL-18]
MKKIKFKMSFIVLLLITFTIVLGACSSKTDTKALENSKKVVDEGTPQKGGNATIAYETDVANFDPIKASGGINFPLLFPVYDTLIHFSPDLEPQPGLAVSWKYSNDSTLILTLRENVKFHDGTPFNAEAVKFNIDRINSDKSMLTDLKNIISVKVIDEKTVQLNLKQPDSSILLALSDQAGMMVSPTAVEKNGESYSQHPIGTGPFKMSRHVPNGEIVYEANKEYWDKDLPYLDKMTVKIMPEETTRINALKSGEVDFAENISPGTVSSLVNDKNLKVLQEISLPFKMLYLNDAKAPLDNKAVRQAINFGIDREALIKAINFGIGEPAYQPFPKAYWAANKDLKINYDPEKAKQILKEAGINKVSFTLVHHSMAYDQRVAEAIKSQLAEIGIEVKLQAMEQQAALANFWDEKKANSFLGRWSARPDPQITMKALYSSGSYYNTGHTTAEIDKLIAEAGKTYDQEKRAKLYRQISEKAILEEAIGIPLFFTPRTAIMNQSLKGYVPNKLEKPVFSTLWKKE